MKYLVYKTVKEIALGREIINPTLIAMTLELEDAKRILKKYDSGLILEGLKPILHK